MAKIKFDPEATPLNKEHYGFTFQRNNYGFSMFPAGKNDRKRYGLQWEKMQFISKAIRNWRNMSPETKNAWNVFATTYPQPTEKDPNVFLTGYQLFLKRHFYRFLHEGINFDFMLSPELAELPTPDFSIEILEDGMCVDVTEEYIRNHGILPKVGQFVICRVIPIATNSGQFFAPFIATLEVQEVYIDGLVCSFNFPNVVENIVFSLYMSRPVYESNQYAGTKFRFMGCFKPTKFIQLTDTPDSYEGEAGKIVKVKDDETGLEFSEGSGCEICPPVPGEGDAGKVITVNPAGDGYELAEGGGGSFDCEDLLECDIIQQIIDNLSNLTENVLTTVGSSLPPVNFGYLYSTKGSVYGRENIASSPDWHLPTISELFSLISDFFVSNYNITSDSMDFWNNPTGNNSSKLNFRGTGFRASNGSFSGFKNAAYLIYLTAEGYPKFISMDPSGMCQDHFIQPITGLPWRLVRNAAGMPDGKVGSYIGNDGRIYRTITFNGVEWMADNLAETKLSDGYEIPTKTSNSDWNNMPNFSKCAYNNNLSNV